MNRPEAQARPAPAQPARQKTQALCLLVRAAQTQTRNTRKNAAFRASTMRYKLSI
jgi:hypothetical protein